MQFVGGFLGDVVSIILWVIQLYIYVLVVAVIFSWLFAFNILDRRQPIVQQIYNVLLRLTEPALRPIRRFMPDLGGLDISPIILFFGLILLQSLIRHAFIALFA